MNDRELLELAAKAAKYWIVGPAEKYVAQLGHYEGGFIIRNDRGGDSCWNPLTDDGDALRLAVKCRLDINQGGSMVVSERTGPQEVGVAEPHNDDPYAATRRAIVRAAAEIGKNV